MAKESIFQKAEVEGPKVNHLGLLVDADGSTIAVPPGATMIWFIQGEQPMPFILIDVRKDKLVFKCRCGSKTCTRKYIWKLTHSSGTHG